MKKLNLKLVGGLSVVTLIVIVSLVYRTQVSPMVENQQTNTVDTEVENKQTNTIEKEEKETINPKNSPSPTIVNKSPTIVKEDSVTPDNNTLVITEKDFGQYFTPSKGQQVFLRLSKNFSWIESEPKTTGTVVLARINQNNQTYREWQVNFPAPSTATIESNISTGTLGTDAEITRFFVTIKSI